MRAALPSAATALAAAHPAALRQGARYGHTRRGMRRRPHSRCADTAVASGGGVRVPCVPVCPDLRFTACMHVPPSPAAFACFVDRSAADKALETTSGRLHLYGQTAYISSTVAKNDAEADAAARRKRKDEVCTHSVLLAWPLAGAARWRRRAGGSALAAARPLADDPRTPPRVAGQWSTSVPATLRTPSLE